MDTAPTCGLCDRELHDTHLDHQLCRHCTDATRARLHLLPGRHRALAAFLAPAGRRPELVPGAGPVEAPLPVNERVLDLRGPGGIAGILEDWRTTMQEDRGWGPPAPTPGSIENRVRVAARALLLNLDWIAEEWPAAGAFARELRDLEHDIRSIAERPERTYRIGQCIELRDDGGLCGANLRAVRDPDDGTAPPVVTCPWCGTDWPPDTWGTLRAHQPDPEGATP